MCPCSMRIPVLAGRHQGMGSAASCTIWTASPACWTRRGSRRGPYPMRSSAWRRTACAR
ncbi:hypothetical protein AZA_87587 [Nitrospirillum viridazoti Y2]|nr:hypothetical protein AZA_87587 [Nitrospirillum amazonense Y2]